MYFASRFVPRKRFKLPQIVKSRHFVPKNRFRWNQIPARLSRDRDFLVQIVAKFRVLCCCLKSLSTSASLTTSNTTKRRVAGRQYQIVTALCKFSCADFSDSGWSLLLLMLSFSLTCLRRGFPPLARRHSCEFSEICVEVAAVAVADGFADSFRFHLGVLQQHPTGIMETKSVSP